MRSSLERYLPVAYLVASFVLIAATLPTVLRPPQPPPPTSAEFSPDIPPDEDHEVILSELSRGTTMTAGAGDEVAADGGPGVAAPVEELVPRRGLCFGDPPRQIESIYGPPCAAAWTGDNAGATWQGVTATEVRIAVHGPTSAEGPVPSEPQEGESAEQRTVRVYQTYFNERFELYNRRIQFYVISDATDSGEGSAAERQRAAVQRADAEYKVFGLVNNDEGRNAAQYEAVRRELIHFGRQFSPEVSFREHAPYMWSFSPDSHLMRRLAAEMVCKQMGDNPPEFNNQMDPTFDYAAPRKYGVVAYQDDVHFGAIETWEEELAKCGLSFEPGAKVYMNLGDDAAQMAGAVTRMRQAGVTTVVVLTDPLAPIVLTNEAQNSRYFPEWVHMGRLTDNGTAGLYNQSQWRHAIGLNVFEIPSGRTSGCDGHRAYKEIDPENDPAGFYNCDWFLNAMHMVSGIQLAGPELTPHTFQEGMQRAFPVRAPEPYWTVGGGYRPGKWTYPEYASLQWWDSDAPRPGGGFAGAYRYPDKAQRYRLGELPTEKVPFFEDDPSHITEVPPEDRM